MHRLFFFFLLMTAKENYSLLAALWSGGVAQPCRLPGAAQLLLTHVTFQTIYLSPHSAATRGNAERREMDTIMAGIKAALKCTWARRWFLPLLLLAFFGSAYLDKKEFWQTYTGVSWKLWGHYKILTTKFLIFTVLAEFLWLPWSRSLGVWWSIHF